MKISKVLKISAIFAITVGLCVSVMQKTQAKNPAGILQPTSAWLVGESQILGPGERVLQAKPCTIVQQFNNGYLFRFTGTDERLKVLALDFRKDVFSPGEFYKLQVQVSPRYVEEVVTKAINASTILINMEDELKGFSETLKDDQFIRLQFFKRNQTFSLKGIELGLERMAQCYRDISVQDSYNLNLPTK
jgi:hypothetical protein